MRKINGKNFALILLVVLAIYLGILLTCRSTPNVTEIVSTSISTSLADRTRHRLDEVVVLIWTTYYFEHPVKSYRFDAESDPECFANCRIVTDKSYFNVSDAVVFHSRDLKRKQLPQVHPRDQIWVYLQQESPSYTELNLTEFPHVFNWTMTYRRDSDVYHPYNRVVPVDLEAEPELMAFNIFKIKQLANQKKKLVAWIVSHCATKSGRERYVRELSKFVRVDVYGSCGYFNCSQAGDGVGCLANIAKEYKFYLSFENSACSDYVTEKFFRALKYNLIPVVYGGADYNLIGPPGSFINIRSFSSPRALAEYLLELDKDEEKYLAYFQWASKFKIVHGGGWCELCRKLEEQRIRPVENTYEDIHKWWFNINYEEGSNDSSRGPRRNAKITRWNHIDPSRRACHDSKLVMKT